MMLPVGRLCAVSGRLRDSFDCLDAFFLSEPSFWARGSTVTICVAFSSGLRAGVLLCAKYEQEPWLMQNAENQQEDGNTEMTCSKEQIDRTCK